MKARATRATTTTSATAVLERPRRVPVPAAAATTAPADSDERMRASATIARIAHPPRACPACYAERGDAFPPDTSGHTCRWHELVGWVTLATRNPALWPRVRARYGEVVLLRLADGNGSVMVDIAVR